MGSLVAPTKCVRGVCCALNGDTPQKGSCPLTPLSRALGGLQGQEGTGAREKGSALGGDLRSWQRRGCCLSFQLSVAASSASAERRRRPASFLCLLLKIQPDLHVTRSSYEILYNFADPSRALRSELLFVAKLAFLVGLFNVWCPAICTWERLNERKCKLCSFV